MLKNLKSTNILNKIPSIIFKSSNSLIRNRMAIKNNYMPIVKSSFLKFNFVFPLKIRCEAGLISRVAVQSH